MVGQAARPGCARAPHDGDYGAGSLEALDYHVVEDEASTTAWRSTARRNSMGPNYVRFGLSLQDDFQGNSTLQRRNALRACRRSPAGRRMGVGSADRRDARASRPRSTCRCRSSPAGSSMPHVQIRGTHPVGVLSDQQPHRRVPRAQLRIRTRLRQRVRQLGRDTHRRAARGGQFARARSAIRRIRPAGAEPTPFGVHDYFVRFSYDRLDDVNFPHRGQQAALQWDANRNGTGVDQVTNQVTFSYVGAYSFGRNTGSFSTNAGVTLGPNVTDVRSVVSARRVPEPVGAAQNSLMGPDFAIARMLLVSADRPRGPGVLRRADVPRGVVGDGNVWQRPGAGHSSTTQEEDTNIFLTGHFTRPVCV